MDLSGHSLLLLLLLPLFNGLLPVKVESQSISEKSAPSSLVASRSKGICPEKVVSAGQDPNEASSWHMQGLRTNPGFVILGEASFCPPRSIDEAKNRG